MATSKCKQAHPDQAFAAFIISLPEKTSTTVRFFERNDYYTVHGSDAIFAAKEVFKTMSVVKTIGFGPHKVESVCLSKLNFDSFIRNLLLLKQYRVEIYRNRGIGKTHDWYLECKASPGNLTQLEDVLFGSEGTEMIDSQGAIAIKVKSGSKEQVVGVAFGDPVLRDFRICEFNDNNSFSTLEAVLAQLTPKECLLSSVSNNPVTDEVKKIIKRNNILLVECKPGNFSAGDICQDLDRLLKSKEKLQSSALLETDLKIAIQCVAALIKYFELLSDETNFGQFVLTSFNPQQYMRLDMSAIRSLGILPTSLEENKNHSLLGLLNRCRTAQGQRLLTQWIKQPLVDKLKLEERLDIVESFVSDTELRQSLFENYLRRVPDLQLLSKKFQKLKADLQDVYKVYVMVNQLPYLHDCLFQHNGPFDTVIKATFCSDIKDRISDFEKFQAMVKLVMDLEAVEDYEFIVKPECDPKLKELRELMKKSQSIIGRQIDKVAKDLDLEANKTVKLENCRQIGYYFRVTRKEERALRGKKDYFTIDTKQSGVRFYNSALRELNEKYMSLRKSYEELQSVLVKELVDIAATYCPTMIQLGETIAHLDVLVSFSCVAFNAPKPYVRPKLTEKGAKGIILKEARHPCLEVLPSIDFIPNGIEMEKDKKMFYIITGPNMGGKSTYIRSIALNVLMAQIGSFVPCDEADISIVDSILTRVGAGDQQLKGVSTFMAEMLEVKHILKTATSDSLIIVDELGRGTSTFDGFGLAWALSEYIASELKSYCLFTTHFHELAALADEVDSIANLHVTAVTSEESITFLYRVKPGVCDQSFGIHVAEMANFPKSVIEFSKLKLTELEEGEVVRAIKDSDGEPRMKKPKNAFEEAQTIFEEFIENVAIIDSTYTASEEDRVRFKYLKIKLLESTNPYVQRICKKA